MKKIGLTLLLNGFFSLFSFGQQKDTLIYIKPDILPTFKYDTCSTSISSLKKYFEDNYKMPKILLDNGYSGSVYVEFVVEKNGSISNLRLLRGIDPPLDKSVVEFVYLMPKWNPGLQDNQKVRARQILPVSIRWLYGPINK